MTVYDGLKLFFLTIGRALRNLFTKQTPLVYRKPASGAPVHYLQDDTDFHSIEDVKNLAIGTVTGLLWDLQGAVLDGQHQRGGGGQAENQEPLFSIRFPGLIIRNGFIRNQKESIRVIAATAVFENLTFTDIGEDAISTFGIVEYVRVHNCEFINPGGDKCLQWNSGLEITVSDCVFTGCITGIRWGSRAGGPMTGLSHNNKFIKVQRAHNCSGPETLVMSKGDSYKDVNGKFVTTDGAKFIQK